MKVKIKEGHKIIQLKGRDAILKLCFQSHHGSLFSEGNFLHLGTAKVWFLIFQVHRFYMMTLRESYFILIWKSVFM
uniref:Uncharacterized protein n=1 Tax=Rhizophora mucronata TaxID=61149 RepID=A0A2P2MM08_RHIMU